MLKRILIALFVVTLAFLLYSVFFGSLKTVFWPLSPKDSAAIELNDLKLKVEYNRPSKRERDIFGALVPYNKVWRTGANEATTFSTNKDLIIQGMLLPKGDYTLWTVPMEERWKVMFNSGQYQWGVDEKMEPMWDPNYDVIELEVPVKQLESVVEKFTISFDNATGNLKMTLAWDSTMIEIPIQLIIHDNPNR